MKKLIIALSVWLAVFAAICIGATCAFISNGNSAAPTTSPETDFSRKATINLDAMYDENDLLIDSLSETVNGVEISYPQIKGLKDKTTQDKINTELYARTHELIKKHQGDLTYADFSVEANFANVLSLSFHLGFDYEPYNERLFFNYSLVDGSPIALEDLFLPDFDVLSLVRKGFYSALIYTGEYDEYDGTYITSPDEDDLYATVRGYMSQANKAFTFTPASIYLYSDNHTADIPMIDYADFIVIYSAHLTDESIFSGEYKGFKNLFTCSDISNEYFDQIEYGYIEDNMWYDFTVEPDWLNEPQTPSDENIVSAYNALRSDVIAEYYAEIDAYRQTARQNPDKFYAVFFKPSSYLYTDSEYIDGKWYETFSPLTALSDTIQVYEMPMSVYNDSFKALIAETYRYNYFVMRGGAFISEDELSSSVSYFSETDNRLYNCLTGEEYTSLDEVFVPYSAYMEVIKNCVENYFSDEPFTPDDFEILFSEMTCTLCGTAVCVTFKSLDRDITVSFSSFDKTMFKCFN